MKDEDKTKKQLIEELTEPRRRTAGSEKLKKLINLWNYSLSAGSTNLFGMDAPYVYLEVGRVAVERLRGEGVELVKDTPIDTINAVYAYFVEHGYFEEARARLPLTGGYEGEGEIYEFYEKGCISFESNRWAFYGGECRSPACLCYNIFRYTLSSRFGLDLKLIDVELKEETKEEFAKVALIPVSREAVGELSLMEEVKNERVKLLREIADRKQSEETLRENEDRLGVITEMAGDGIICMKEPGIIYMWNRRAEDIFGYSAEEAEGKKLHQLIVPERYREKAREGMKVFFETGAGAVVGKTVELSALRKDGSEFPVELSISAMRIGGRWHSAGIIRDITERKKAEEALREKLDEIERMNRLMVGRELKMEELRKEIRRLKERIGEMEGE